MQYEAPSALCAGHNYYDTSGHASIGPTFTALYARHNYYDTSGHPSRAYLYSALCRAQPL